MMTYGPLARVYDRLMSDVDYDHWAAFIRKHASLVPGNRVIDAACGTGSISIRLAKAGMQVVGMDASEEMLFTAAENARKSGVRIQWVQEDISRMEAHRQVDAVCCVCDGINYLQSQKTVTEFFASAYHVLKPDGSFIFDMSSEYKLKKKIGNNLFFEDYDDLTYFWQNTPNEKTQTVQMELCFFLQEGETYRRFDEMHLQHWYNSAVLVQLLKDAGFSSIALSDGYTQALVQPTSERITFVCKK